jgi:hypothetical protein
LDPKTKSGVFELDALSRSLQPYQVPLRKKVLLRLGLNPTASEVQSTRVIYGFCGLHGYYTDHPHGLGRQYIQCPKCLANKSRDEKSKMIVPTIPAQS